MSDPATPTGTVAALALGALVALLGPLFGQLVLIVAASVLGALLAVSRASTPTFGRGAWMLLRGVLAAVLIGGGLSWLWIDMAGGRFAESLAVVSALIGFRTDWALERVRSVTSERFGGEKT